MDLEGSVEPFKQYLANLGCEEKLFTVRKIVDKVIATKEQVRICGKIPAYATSLSVNKVGLDAEHSETQGTIQHNNQEQVGLNAEHRYKYCVTQQPFELKLTMPPTDRGGRGYSDEYIAKAAEQLLKR